MGTGRPLVKANRRIQQREIAAQAGVSVSTVSRVLNGVAGISEPVQRRVLSAAAALGYPVGAQRAAGPVQQISLVTNLPLAESLDPFHADVLNGVESECGRQGVQLIYTTTGKGPLQAEQIAERVRQQPGEGLLLLSVDDSALIEQLRGLGLPLVMINIDRRDLPVDSFLPDNWYGAHLAVSHLIANGHRRIGHLTWPERSTIRRRSEVYRAALAEAGLAFDPALVIEAPLNAESAYAAVRKALSAGRAGFSALFCANDASAIGAVRALQETGLRVPADVSVVGFDDLPMTAFLTPPLTTVRIEREELGVLAVRRLLDRAAAPQLTPIRVELACRLVERQSVRPARSADP